MRNPVRDNNPRPVSSGGAGGGGGVSIRRNHKYHDRGAKYTVHHGGDCGTWVRRVGNPTPTPDREVLLS